MAAGFLVRRARPADAAAISRLNNSFAHAGQMLVRTPEMIAIAIDDYVVAQTGSDDLLACGALKEYSPSVAEVAAIAVSREAHGRGLGRAIVGAVETLARKRGIHDVFALTLQPEFFAAIGYQRVDRARYPEDSGAIAWAARGASPATRLCFAKNLMAEQAVPLAA